MHKAEEAAREAIKYPNMFWNEFLKHIEDMDDHAIMEHRHWVNNVAAVANGRAFWKHIPPERRPKTPLWDDIKAKR